jgi:hypothetical protein
LLAGGFIIENTEAYQPVVMRLTTTTPVNSMYVDVTVTVTVTCHAPPFPAQFAPLCHGKQFPKTIQEYDVQHTRVHTDRSHKRQPEAAMPLRALPWTLGTSPLCPISASAQFEYEHARERRNGWNEYATRNIREGNG